MRGVEVKAARTARTAREGGARSYSGLHRLVGPIFHPAPPLVFRVQFQHFEGERERKEKKRKKCISDPDTFNASWAILVCFRNPPNLTRTGSFNGRASDLFACGNVASCEFLLYILAQNLHEDRTANKNNTTYDAVCM